MTVKLSIDDALHEGVLNNFYFIPIKNQRMHTFYTHIIIDMRCVTNRVTWKYDKQFETSSFLYTISVFTEKNC